MPVTRASRRRPRPADGPTTTLAAILAGAPAAVALLAASDRSAWQVLAAALADAEACPPELLHTLLAIDDREGWHGRLFRAFAGLNPDVGMEADWHFGRWFAAGLRRHLPATAPAALELRYRDARDDAERGTTERTRALATAIAAAGDSAAHRRLGGRAALLLALRLEEDGAFDAALTEATRAEAVFGALGDGPFRLAALRARVGLLLRLERLDEALVLADAAFADAAASGPTDLVRHRLPTVEDPRARILAAAARAAVGARSPDDQAWIAALGALAELTGHVGCARRFEAGQRTQDARARERALADGASDLFEK